MTDAPDLPSNTTPKRWRVTMADKTARVIEARGFRVEHGESQPQAGVERIN